MAHRGLAVCLGGCCWAGLLQPVGGALGHTDRRLALPDHLPVEEVEIYPEGDLSNMVCIGKEITDELEMDEPGIQKGIAKRQHRQSDGLLHQPVGSAECVFERRQSGN